MTKSFKLDFWVSCMFIITAFAYIFIQLAGFESLVSLSKYVFMSGIIFLSGLMLIRDKLTKTKVKYLFPLFIFVLVYSVSSLREINIPSITGIATQLCYFLLVYFVSSINWSKRQLKALSVSAVILILILSTYIASLVVTNQYDAINPNTMGAYTLFLMYFPLLHLLTNSKVKFSSFKIMVVLFGGMSLIYFSNSRSILLAIFVGIITYVFWKVIIKSKFLFKAYFLLHAAIVFSVTVLYPKIYLWSKFPELENLSLHYTGKTIVSGRGILWEFIMDNVIALKPIFGYGAGTNLSSFMDTNLSSHSVYLHTAMQSGIVGLALLVLFFYLLWKSFMKNINNKATMLSASFVIAILYHQLFEVSLVQMNFGIGVLQWLIIGFSLNLFFRNNNNPTK